MRDGIDDSTLLCEDCGYVIEGLPEPGNCPECGTAIAESLPARRVGTPLQRAGGVTAWLGAGLRGMRPNRGVFSTMRPGPRFERGPWVLFAPIGALGPAVFATLVHHVKTYVSVNPKPPSETVPLAIAIAFGMYYVVSMGVLWTATRIEFEGLGLIARHRGFRVSQAYRHAVVSQGSAGWLLLLPAGLAGAAAVADYHGMINGGVLPIDLTVVGSWGAAILTIAGFMIFEFTAYLGLRELRFANAPGEERVAPNQPNA